MRKLYTIVSKNHFCDWSRDTDLIFTSKSLAEQFTAAHVHGWFEKIIGHECDVVAASVVNTFDTEIGEYTYKKSNKKETKKAGK